MFNYGWLMLMCWKKVDCEVCLVIIWGRGGNKIECLCVDIKWVGLCWEMWKNDCGLFVDCRWVVFWLGGECLGLYSGGVWVEFDFDL